MNMRALAYLATATRIAIGIVCVGFSASATEVWQTLPATPPLPQGTISRHVNVNGVRIWYGEWGEQPKGIPVLLLHGGFGNSNYFGHLIPFLVEHGYHVIAMDSRGHGRSTRTNAPYSYHLMAEDVMALLNELHLPRVSVVGWSDGGCIGFDLALNHPDRLTRLFTFGANADVSGDRDGFDKSPVFAAYLERVQVEYRSLSPTPDQWDSFSAAVGKMWETLPAYTTNQLRSLKVPTTIADGEYDEAIRQEHNQYMVSAIPDARLVILLGVSHFAMLQNPTEFNAAVLEFLRDGK
jgi:pimeloyl-ACP methyl ester carboxylesterase